MYRNYEKRVKDFILDMADPNSKIVIKDISKRINLSREKLMSETGEKKPFIFKGYKNEIDRIKDSIKNNKYLFNSMDYKKSEKFKKTKSLSFIKNGINNLTNNTNRKKIDYFSIKKKSTNNKKYINNNKSNNIYYNSSSDLFNKNKDLVHPFISNTEKKNPKKNDIILQPITKFNPRKELEMLYDALDKKYLEKNESRMIERQLKNLDLYDSENPEDLLNKFKINIEREKEKSNDIRYAIYSSPIIKEEKAISNKKIWPRINTTNDLYYKQNKNINKPLIKHNNLNKDSQNIIKKNNYKTHFKAAEEIAENKNEDKNLNKTHFLSSFVLRNINKKKHKHNNNKINDSNKDAAKKSNLNYDLNFKNSINKDWECFEDKFNGNKKNKKLEINDESLKLLANMAFKVREDDFFFQNKSDEFNIKEKNIEDNNFIFSNNEEIYDDNSLLIENKIYNKNNQFNLIANKILKICNVYSDKSKFNTNSLKEKNGKTMITKGLSIKQFEKKYGLHS